MSEEKIKYTIKAKHFFMFSKMYYKMGLKKELELNNNDLNSKSGQMSLGINLIDGFLGSLWKVENESYQFLSAISGYSLEKIIEMDFDEYINIWKDLLLNSQMKEFIKKLIPQTFMRKLNLSMQGTDQEQKI